MTEEELLRLGTLERVRVSCCTLNAVEVRVDMDNVETFVATIDPEMISKAGASLASEGLTNFDGLISFDTEEDEIGFIAITHALDFSSGFRKPLHAFHGLGAWNTVKAGLVRIFHVNPKMTAQFFSEQTLDSVIALFLPGLKECEEESIRLPLLDLSKLFLMIVHELGSNLTRDGFADMSSFVLRQVDGKNRGANSLVQGLVDTFPLAFKDVHTYSGGESVFLYKKAQLVTGELYHRFRATRQEFNFADANELTCYCDNVIVATMRKTGCVVCQDELNQKIEKDELIPSGSPDEIALRAKALEAVELIAQRINVFPSEVGNYLWGVLGKEPSFRSYPRHATRDTVFY